MGSTECPAFVLCGHVAHSTEAESMVQIPDACIGIQGNKIIFVDTQNHLSERLAEFQIKSTNVTYLEERQFIIPGFIDTHLHAPQYPNCGKGLDRGLLEWLDTYTFPTEAKFKDLTFAQAAYSKVVQRVLRNGTTTGCYFATIDTDATLVLCDVISEMGQRAYVGKVNMNQNSPDFYIESTDHSVSETKRFIETVQSRKYHSITPIITPRFAISCCEELMKRLGDLAREYSLPIQTHICETKPEIEAVTGMFPGYDSYADVYDKAGLLTDKTVLAHGIYLKDSEMALVKQRKSSISHCPNSNLSIRSGVLDVQKLLKHKVKVGLGTDISGGYHPSMLDAIRTAVHSSNMKAIEHADTGYKAITVRDAFKLATLGGAEALGMADKIGNFEVGKEFDALVIDVCSSDSIIDVFPDETVDDCIDKYLYTGDDRNVTNIFVAGTQVYRKMEIKSVKNGNSI